MTTKTNGLEQRIQNQTETNLPNFLKGFKIEERKILLRNHAGRNEYP
jgi:hypothetical protein